MDFKNFRIPNRDVKLTQFEASITRTKTFQRLFYLKQLGLAYLVYPCATHTRAGHSIECLDEANNILEALKISNDNEDWGIIRLAALLHDMGHVPFSHSLEDENKVLPKHDKGERIDRVLDELIKELNGDDQYILRVKDILYAISSKDESIKDWRSDIVGNTVCADLLAYITTDAAWTGIEKRPGYYRIYEYFETLEKRLEDGTNQKRLCIQLTKGGLRTDIVSSVLDLLDMRYALTERVLFHHAKAIASAMLARAARLVDLKDEPILLEMGDESFIKYLDEKAKECSNPGAATILEHLQSRNLYKRIFKIQRQAMLEWNRTNSCDDSDSFCNKWRDGKFIEDTLAKIESKHSLPPGSLVIWCPEDKSGMKLVRANVTWEHANGWHNPVQLRDDAVKRQYPGIHERVHTIEEQYYDLWNLWVGLQPEYLLKTPAIIDELTDAFGIECDELFRKTYAEKFVSKDTIYYDIKDTFKDKYLPRVNNILLKSKESARESTDDITISINQAISSIIDEDRKEKAKNDKKGKNTSKQQKLFNDVNERDDKENDTNESDNK